MPLADVAVAARPARPADHDFLRELFLASRPELALLRELGPAGHTLVDQQLMAQRAQYLTDHPDARDEILVLDGERVGRRWTAQTGTEVRLLDLAVHPRHRRQGVARSALAGLCERAGSAGLVVRLSVWLDNPPARALYTAVGFRAVAEHGGYLAMEWRAGDETSADAR